MVIDHPLRRRTMKLGPRRVPTVWSVVAGLAALLGYGVHHLPVLRGHPTFGVALSLGAAAVAAVGLGRLLGGPRPSSGREIVVAGPDAGQVRPLQRDDLPFCAQLHLDALPHGFFARLGPRFLRAYYASFLESPHAVALLAAVRGHPAGFLVGIVDPPLHRRWVLRHRGGWLAVLGATALAIRPSVAIQFLRTRVARYIRTWRRHRPVDAPVPAGGMAPAVLSHVAVLPGARGSGLGAQLVRSFEQAAGRAGAPRAVLTTLAGAGGASDFYVRRGWRRTHTHTTPEGQHMEEWARDLSATASPH